MNSQTVANWIQVLTGIALLVGLVLVIFELQQTRDLVRAQLTSDGFRSLSENQRAFLGESFAETYAKACFSPDSLSDAELIQMHAYHEDQITMAARARIHTDVASHSQTWRQTARGRIRDWLSTKVGRAAYMSGRDKEILASWIIPIAEDLIARGDIYDCSDDFSYFDLVRANEEPLLDALRTPEVEAREIVK